MDMKDKYTAYAEECLDNIFDAMDQIKLNSIMVLTGENATGKSLIRKALAPVLTKQNNGERVRIADISMERRTGLHSELGGGGVFLRDTEWVATSSNSIHNIRSICKATDRYIVLDEPEIGCGLSMQASIAEFLNKTLPEVLQNNKGVLIITHSKEIVKRLNNVEFINLQKLTKEEWLSAEPVIIDFEEFEEKQNALFHLVQDHLNKKS